MLALVAATIQFVLVHTLDGRALLINPNQIVTFGEPRDKSQVTGGVRCVITLSDGKFVSVLNSCVSVKEQMEKVGR